MVPQLQPNIVQGRVNYPLYHTHTRMHTYAHTHLCVALSLYPAAYMHTSLGSYIKDFDTFFLKPLKQEILQARRMEGEMSMDF